MPETELLILAVALAAALIAGVLAACHLSGLTPHAVALLWAVALWAGRRATARAVARARRAHARYYHRHRYGREKCHARPTAPRRARLAARRLLSLRLRAQTDATVPATTRPDITAFVRHA
jgi:hypothetical protein